MVEKLSFNLSNFGEQEFSFPLKLIQFINKEADPEIKQKLDRTCKYFYKELPYCIIDTLEIGNLEDDEDKQRIENVQYDGCIDFIDDEEVQMFLLKADNIWLTKKLNATYNDDLDEWIFDKIVRCDAPEISLVDFDIPFKKLEILTKSGNVESFDMSGSRVEYSDETPVPLEDVLALLPNARKIFMNDCHITKNTMKKLLATPWKQKLTEFSLKNVDDEFDVKLFFHFVKKHVDPDAQIHVDFDFESRYKSWAARPLLNLFKYDFEKLYYKLLESGEKLPTITSIGPKKQTWREYILSFSVYFTHIFQLIKRKFIPSKNKFKMDEVSIPQKKASFNEENMERQYLAFPYPHMCYIREIADAETMKKLEQTCKFFHKRNPYLIVDDLEIEADHTLTMVMNNKKISVKNEDFKSDKLLWVTNSLDFDCVCHGFSNIGRMEAKEIFMEDAVVPFEIFKMLTASGLVKEWDSIDGTVKNANEDIISLVELLFHLPHADTVCADVNGIYARNLKEPMILPQCNNIKKLELKFLKGPVHVDEMFDMLMKVLAPKAKVELDLSKLTAEEMDVARFKVQMKTKLNTWKPQIDMPTFKIAL